MDDLKVKILVVDDEVSIQRLLKMTIENAGYKAMIAKNGTEALHDASNMRPELIVLDMGLPDMRGSEVLKTIRSWSLVPVLILSVEKDHETIVEALDLGADDYMTKPFQADELLARIRVCLRRNQKAQDEKSKIEIGNVTLDLVKHLVTKKDQVVKLTSTEYDLFVYLVKNAGKVVTHRQMLLNVWGPNASEDSSYTRVYIRHLRQKLEENPEEPIIILNEPGVGYRLVL
jgi:two-component system KDP operon response regulator KdpE